MPTTFLGYCNGILSSNTSPTAFELSFISSYSLPPKFWRWFHPRRSTKG